MNARLVLAVAAALAAGAAAGFFAGQRTGGEAVAATRPAQIRGSETLQAVPPAPLDATAETVRLPAGLVSHHVHGGPTLNLIVSGRVRLVDDDRPDAAREFGPGGFFAEPGDRPHTVTALEDTRIDVVRLIPPGGAATTPVR